MSILYLFPTASEATLFERLCPSADSCVIGVGMAAAGAAAARLIVERSPRRVVLCGIAGACDERLSVGEVVEVVSDCVAGLPPHFLRQYRCRAITSLPSVCSFTVSRTGQSLPLSEGGESVCCDKALPAIEQMEGAAVAAVAEQLGVEFTHIRSISNRVSDPRSAWRIEEAVEALAGALAAMNH